MVRHRSVTFDLKPTPRQMVALGNLLASQRGLYNAALEARMGRWRWSGGSTTLNEQFADLSGPNARDAIPSLVKFGVAPHRGTLRRLDEAYSAFFRRIKMGGTPGFPRFKSEARWNSVAYPEASCWTIHPTGEKSTYGRLKLMGVGAIKVHLKHGKKVRTGDPCRLVVKRRGNRWECTVFYKNVAPRETPAPVTGAVGLDRGIDVLVAGADSDGGKLLIDNPRHLRSAATSLARKQRRLSRCQPGSKRRAKASAEVARAHQKIAARRRGANHELTTKLVDEYQTIVLEKLEVQNMVRRAKPKPDPDNPGQFLPNGQAAKSGLNRSILDAAWGQIAQMIIYKAEEAGREVVFVKPHFTSQDCNACGHRDAGNREGTVFKCLACGHVDHADLNAARNILRSGSDHVRRNSGVTPRSLQADVDSVDPKKAAQHVDSIQGGPYGLRM